MYAANAIAPSHTPATGLQKLLPKSQDDLRSRIASPEKDSDGSLPLQGRAKSSAKSPRADKSLLGIHTKRPVTETEISGKALKSKEPEEHPDSGSQPEKKPPQSPRSHKPTGSLPEQKAVVKALQTIEEVLGKEETDKTAAKLEESQGMPARSCKEASAHLPADPSIIPAKRKDLDQQPSALKSDKQEGDSQGQKEGSQRNAAKAVYKSGTARGKVEQPAAKDQTLPESKANPEEAKPEAKRKLEVSGQDKVEGVKKATAGKSFVICKNKTSKLQVK